MLLQQNKELTKSLRDGWSGLFPEVMSSPSVRVSKQAKGGEMVGRN